MPQPAMQTKTFGRLEIKEGDKGEVTAVVSVLNVVDRDKDVILPGAIPNGTRVKLSAYGHGVVLYDEPPAGKGILEIVGEEVRFRGQYFMETQAGRDAFAVVKGLGEDGEWSIGFLNVQTKPLTPEWKAQGARRVITGIDVVEVSPVFMGANQLTETIGTKAADESAEDQSAAAAREEAARASRLAIEAKATDSLRAEFVRFERTRKRLGLR